MQLNVSTYEGFAALTASDTTLVRFRALYINCTVAGNVALSIDGSTAAVAFAVAAGTTLLPVELKGGRLMSTGTTATATYVGLQ